MSTEFNGNLKDAIIAMLSNQTDSCEITHTIDDLSITVELTIKKIVEGDEVVYDATAEGDAEVVAFDEADTQYLS